MSISQVMDKMNNILFNDSNLHIQISEQNHLHASDFLLNKIFKTRGL